MFEQLTLVSALLGGFAFTFLGAILSKNDSNKLTSSTRGLCLHKPRILRDVVAGLFQANIRNVPAYKNNVIISNLWQVTLRGR